MNLLTNLFPHQQQAVEKLRRLRVGALYMEQGTGKTRTTLELIKIRLDAQKVDCVLWLCPCSVKKNLKDDIITHCGEMPKEIIIRGIESLSSSDRLYLQLLTLVEKHTVFLIVDESNLTKNGKAIRTARITAISAKCKYKMILNGTPVSRNEADMFAQWFILDWRILGYKSYYSFAHNHLEFRTIKTAGGHEVKTDQIARVLNVNYLTEKIAPYTYQILKADCLSLPPKTYHRIEFELTPEQGEAYWFVRHEYLDAVDEFRSETIYKLFTALQHVVSGRKVLTGPEESMKTEPMFKDYRDNPRIQTLKRVLLDKIGEEKCLIFAKYQSEIEDIGKLLDTMGLTWRTFTGAVSQKQRQKNKDAFKDDVQFLLANKTCGAYGLNLQFCHNVVYYSNDFDLATRLQSEDRVHRIGQTKPVHIYDIYASRTIDEMIIDCIDRKESMVSSFKSSIKENQKLAGPNGKGVPRKFRI